jgi:uroporphyrinogen-III synthase
MDSVLLLRSPNSDGPDKYQSVFQEAGYHAVSVPVLETLLVNLDELEHVVQTGPEGHGLVGVVVTSARSCEAWRHTVQELVTQSSVAGT